MFVRYYLELPLPARQVEQRVVRAPAGVAVGRRRGRTAAGQRPARPGRGRAPGARLGGGPACCLGEPIHFPSITSLPLTWEPAGLEGLLPGLDAILELGALGRVRTQLAISARYRP